MTAAQSPWSVAFSRFGYGARPGDGSRAGDAKEALLAELSAPGGALLTDPSLQSTPRILQEVFAFQSRKKREREVEAAAKPSALGAPAPEVSALPFPGGPLAVGEAAAANRTWRPALRRPPARPPWAPSRRRSGGRFVWTRRRAWSGLARRRSALS